MKKVNQGLKLVSDSLTIQILTWPISHPICCIRCFHFNLLVAWFFDIDLAQIVYFQSTTTDASKFKALGWKVLTCWTISCLWNAVPARVLMLMPTWNGDCWSWNSANSPLWKLYSLAIQCSERNAPRPQASMNQGLVRKLPNDAPAADGSKHGGKTNSASSCSTCSLLFQKVQCHPIPEHSLLPPPCLSLCIVQTIFSSSSSADATASHQ